MFFSFWENDNSVKLTRYAITERKSIIVFIILLLVYKYVKMGNNIGKCEEIGFRDMKMRGNRFLG